MISVQTCSLCEGRQFKRFDQRDYQGYEVTNWLCRRCGLVFMSPRMDEEELENFYSTEYRKIYQGEENPTPADLLVQQARSKHLIEVASAEFIHSKRHLDIGCSGGLLLEAMHEAFDCQSIGVEPGDAYRTYCLKRGLIVYRTLDELAEIKQESFDLVTMSHVLEHLTDPVGYLTTLRDRFMCTGGYLLVEVPNLYGHSCFEIAHNFSFSRHTLMDVLLKSGFAVMLLREHGAPRSKTRLLYLTVLAQSMANPIPLYRIPRRLPWIIVLRRKMGLSRGNVSRFLERHFKQASSHVFRSNPVKERHR